MAVQGNHAQMLGCMSCGTRDMAGHSKLLWACPMNLNNVEDFSEMHLYSCGVHFLWRILKTFQPCRRGIETSLWWIEVS